MVDRLLLDVDDGRTTLSAGEPAAFACPPGPPDLQWYLEDYRRVPYGVGAARGAEAAAGLAEWGEALFAAVFTTDDRRAAYEAARAAEGPVELVVRGRDDDVPWELLRDPERGRYLALDQVAVVRATPGTDPGEPLPVPGERLRVLSVLSRGDHPIVARPLLDRLGGDVDLVVLRPPTVARLREVVAGFHVVHFDGGGLPGPAGEVAEALRAGDVPLVVANACPPETAAALAETAGSVVALPYRLDAAAAADFLACLYGRLIAGDTVTAAVTAGRERLAERPDRPSLRGPLRLDDWLVPVHHLRRDARFPELLDPKGDPATARETFVGRDDLFHDLEEHLHHRRAALLHGPPGIGKTDLAEAFGRWWARTGGADPGGVVRHTASGPDGVVAALGLPHLGAEFARADRDRRRDLVRRLLGERRLLLILDGLDTLDDDGPAALRDLVADVAGSARGAVLITSRTPETRLGDLPRIEVAGLNAEDAVGHADRLLASVPGAPPRRQRWLFSDLMAALAGHPLAMRLTLPRLADTEPEELLDALRHRGLGRDLLGAGVHHALTYLSADERRRLGAAALFPGVVITDVLAVLSRFWSAPESFRGLGPAAWRAELDRAVATGLLTRVRVSTETAHGLGTGPAMAMALGMYAIHPALRPHLIEEWRAAGQRTFDQEYATTRFALLEATAEFAERLHRQLGEGDAELADRVLRVQYDSLAGVFGSALDARQWRTAQRIAAVLTARWSDDLDEEGREWTARGRRALEFAGGIAPALDGPAGELWFSLVAGDAERHLATGRLAEAGGAYRDLLAALPQRPAGAQLAAVQHQLGRVAEEREDWDEAEEWYRTSLATGEEIDYRPVTAGSRHGLGRVAFERGRLDEADRWFRRSLDANGRLGDRRMTRATCRQLVRVAVARGDAEAALDWLVRCVAPAGPGEIGDRWREITGEPLPPLVRDLVAEEGG
ncbi:tetratricopeptide repeat protein [Herbidospora galbida]|uniref:Tetratricopeptide repeat protein n=1 Tax=Herbidospora galbida TaxID=2575442 RepID=A0A4U3M6N5_9ACTN|nr:tetratricopeptide repeat protein [Herbidospora galbida]TKK84451.1 tetratricopeptide repeat protein [Herbidospora galbida]